MMTLHYEIRICQQIDNIVTMTVHKKHVVQFNVHKTLPCHHTTYRINPHENQSQIMR